ncbi:nitroreductase family protein [Fusobacterium sp.]|uniref:nitroreductase family protein n=1 Tax=Fusobacterium sp. TaxID=68766 RepID=UPI0025BF2777|nr:nitroreductase family protein [Fusobacterium sp.]
MEFEKLAEERYSCRKFIDRKVEKELVDKIIEVALKAPTAVNTQPFKIFLIESSEAKEIMRKITDYTFGAETMLMVGYEKNGGWTRKYDKRNFSDVDASIVATHIMLETYNLGLATTWVGHFDVNLLEELCPVTKDYEMIALFPIGYADKSSQAGNPSAYHYKKKSKEELVEVL